jgi:hypothetical protein
MRVGRGQRFWAAIGFSQGKREAQYGSLIPNAPGGGLDLLYREGPPGWAEHPLRTSGLEIKLNGE